jgi:hypothetical protein
VEAAPAVASLQVASTHGGPGKAAPRSRSFSVATLLAAVLVLLTGWAIGVSYYFNYAGLTRLLETEERDRAERAARAVENALRLDVINLEAVVQSLHGDLTLPAQVEGLVIFAHGSGSSRHSPRNRFVAEQLNTAGLGTLLMDLLTQDEERVDDVTRELRFDIGLLARRVAQVVRWAKNQPELAEAKIGLFGSSTGAAAALVAAADSSEP